MQGMSSYVTMDDLSRLLGSMSGLYEQAVEHGA
jgi:predicted MarR family transcription regulator